MSSKAWKLNSSVLFVSSVGLTLRAGPQLADIFGWEMIVRDN